MAGVLLQLKAIEGDHIEVFKAYPFLRRVDSAETTRAKVVAWRKVDILEEFHYLQ